MIEAIMNATLDPRIVARRPQRRACDAHPGVSGAARTTAASPGGRSATIIRRNRRAVRSRRPFSSSGSAQASPLDLIKVTDAGMSESSSRLRAQREALAHQLLRDLPQTLGVLRVERIRLDAVEGVGSVVHCGHVTVPEVETAPPLDMAPLSARTRAVSCPSPLEPPVISATLPLKSIPSATSLAVVSAPNFAGSRTRDPAVTMVAPPRRRQQVRVRPSRRPDRPIP